MKYFSHFITVNEYTENAYLMSAIIKGNRKKYIWSLFTKNMKPIDYPCLGLHLTRADIELKIQQNRNHIWRW